MFRKQSQKEAFPVLICDIRKAGLVCESPAEQTKTFTQGSSPLEQTKVHNSTEELHCTRQAEDTAEREERERRNHLHKAKYRLL